MLLSFLEAMQEDGWGLQGNPGAFSGFNVDTHCVTLGELMMFLDSVSRDMKSSWLISPSSSFAWDWRETWAWKSLPWSYDVLKRFCHHRGKQAGRSGECHSSWRRNCVGLAGHRSSWGLPSLVISCSHRPPEAPGTNTSVALLPVDYSSQLFPLHRHFSYAIVGSFKRTAIHKLEIPQMTSNSGTIRQIMVHLEDGVFCSH